MNEIQNIFSLFLVVLFTTGLVLQNPFSTTLSTFAQSVQNNNLASNNTGLGTQSSQPHVPNSITHACLGPHIVGHNPNGTPIYEDCNGNIYCLNTAPCITGSQNVPSLSPSSSPLSISHYCFSSDELNDRGQIIKHKYFCFDSIANCEKDRNQILYISLFVVGPCKYVSFPNALR